MKIDYTKVGNGLNFLEQLKLMKVVDKVSNCFMTFLDSSWIMLQAPYQEHYIGYQNISYIFSLDVLKHSTRYLVKQIQE
jgi:hypothetical protein